MHSSISYSGTLDGDALKLTRKVGDVATEELVAHRVAEKTSERLVPPRSQPPCAPLAEGWGQCRPRSA